jgi:hypothetical protein
MHEVTDDGKSIYYHYEDVDRLRPARCGRCGGSMFINDMLNFTVRTERLGKMTPLRRGRPRNAMPAD